MSERQSRRDHYLSPTTGPDTGQVLDHAIEALAERRALGGVGDASVTLHLLASLLAEARSQLSGAVAEARAYQLSWAEIADLLGVTRASAWQCYGVAEAAELAETAKEARPVKARECT